MEQRLSLIIKSDTVWNKPAFFRYTPIVPEESWFVRPKYGAQIYMYFSLYRFLFKEKKCSLRYWIKQTEKIT